MTKYDIRIKRKALSKGQIKRHKYFRGLRNYHTSSDNSGSLIRIILIIVTMILFVGMTVFGIIKINQKPSVPELDDGTEVFDEFKN
jgi:hypothetical protein